MTLSSDEESDLEESRRSSEAHRSKMVACLETKGSGQFTGNNVEKREERRVEEMSLTNPLDLLWLLHHPKEMKPLRRHGEFLRVASEMHRSSSSDDIEGVGEGVRDSRSSSDENEGVVIFSQVLLVAI